MSMRMTVRKAEQRLTNHINSVPWDDMPVEALLEIEEAISDLDRKVDGILERYRSTVEYTECLMTKIKRMSQSL